VADAAAIFRLSHAAPSSFSLPASSLYHFVENPPQTVTSRDSLKE